MHTKWNKVKQYRIHSYTLNVKTITEYFTPVHSTLLLVRRENDMKHQNKVSNFIGHQTK